MWSRKSATKHVSLFAYYCTCIFSRTHTQRTSLSFSLWHETERLLLALLLLLSCTVCHTKYKTPFNTKSMTDTPRGHYVNMVDTTLQTIHPIPWKVHATYTTHIFCTGKNVHSNRMMSYKQKRQTYVYSLNVYISISRLNKLFHSTPNGPSERRCGCQGMLYDLEADIYFCVQPVMTGGLKTRHAYFQIRTVPHNSQVNDGIFKSIPRSNACTQAHHFR